MAYKMILSGNYGTHLAPLIQAVNKTSGDILEMGTGIFSTPYLHYQSLLTKRHLLSIDNNKDWLHTFSESDYHAHKYKGDYHQFQFVEDWDTASIEKPWDVVLIDHSPSERRIIDIKRLAQYAQYLVIHDTHPRHERVYHYSEVYPLFRYKAVWNEDDNPAAVLSNFINLDTFWK